MPEQDAARPRRRTSRKSTSASPRRPPSRRPSAASSARTARASPAARWRCASRSSSTAVAAGDFAAAAEILRTDNALPATTGRVCPQEKQCEARVRPRQERRARRHRLAGALRGRLGERAPRPRPRRRPPKTGFKVAVVGSGPGGLTAAGELARMGHDVTVFEALHAAGGVLRYGIPEFRLPKRIVDQEVANLAVAGREDRVQRHRRQDAHRRADHAGVRRLLHRQRRRPADVPERAGREPQGRLLRQRVPHPREPDGRLARPRPAARRSPAGRRRWSSAAATRPWTPFAPPGGSAASGRSSPTAAAARRCPPASRRSTTPSRRAWSSCSWWRRWRSSATSRAGSAAVRLQRMELGEPDASGRRAPRAGRGQRVRAAVPTSSSSPSARRPTRC